MDTVFGHDSDCFGLHVLKAQGIRVFHISPVAEGKARCKLGQIIRTDRSLDRDLCARNFSFILAKLHALHSSGGRFFTRLQLCKRRRDGHFAIGHHKTDTVSISRVYCACHIFAECVFGCKCVQFIALVRLSSPPHRIPGTSLFIDCFYCPVRAGRYCLLYNPLVGNLNCFCSTCIFQLTTCRQTVSVYGECNCAGGFIPVYRR